MKKRYNQYETYERNRHAKTLRELRETKRLLKFADKYIVELEDQYCLTDWEKLHGSYR